MHTLRTYQMAALQLGGNDMTPSLAAQNYVAAGAQLFGLIVEADTGELNGDDNKAQAVASLGAALYNVAILAERFGLSLDEIAATQLKRLDGATNSGKLRAQKGER